jgi:hypothetical protein
MKIFTKKLEWLNGTLFLKHLRKYGLLPGVTVSIAEIMDYDKSMLVKVSKDKFHLSLEVSKNILIKKYVSSK